jgi:hypothetical protein
MPVFVLDAHSSDGTVAYARAAGATVEERSWKDFVDARSYALSRVTTEWTLQLDADEALDDRLRDAILSARGDVDGYIVRRDTSFAGKGLRMWRDEALLRLVRTKRARVAAMPPTGGAALIHEVLVTDGATSELAGRLQHYSYADRAAYRDKFARYTSIEAAGTTPSVLRSLGAIAFVPLLFARHLLIGGALLDGPKGWFVAWYSALYPAVVALKSFDKLRMTDANRS